MTKKLLIMAGVCLIGGQAFSQDGVVESVGKRSIDMRPNEKRSLTLKSSERNPYAKRAIQEGEDDEAEQSTEELSIRKKLRALSVTGASRSANGLRLLMGDIQIERGIELPQLLKSQTQNLKVIDVAEKKIVLGWVDLETGQLTGKTMKIIYDLTPTVRYVLQGQVGNTEQGGIAKRPEMGILRPRRIPDNSGFVGN